MKTGLILVLSSLALSVTATASAQTVTVVDTIYTPSGYSEGPQLATILVPEIGNGIGVVLVHGCGNSLTQPRPWCDTLASHGYVAMSIDYPDPCVNPGAFYPKKTRAVKLAVEFLRRNAVRFGITTGKIVGFGFSQGADTWGESIIWDNDDAYFQTDSTVDDRLNAAVLLYGTYETYDLRTAQDSANWNTYFSHDSSRAIKGSCVKHVGNITTSLLLMHGTADANTPYQQSVQLHDSLIARGKVGQLLLFDGQPHGFDIIWPNVNVFTPAGLVAKDTALAFLRRVVSPRLKIRVNTPLIDFGNVLLAESDTAAVSISNIGFGLSPLSVNVITNTNPQFALLNLSSFPAIIPAGGSLQFKAAFHPGVQGVSWDTIRIVTDDSLHQVVRITLRGRGIPALRPASPGILYATSGAEPEGYLYSINTLTGAVNAIGAMGTSAIHGLAIRHSDGVIFGSHASPTSTTLYRVTSDFGDAVPTLLIPIGNLRAIAFSRGDTLFGATTTGSLYRINLTTGHADSVGTARGLAYYGLTFRPKRNQLWASVRTPIDSIFTLSTTTGAATFAGITGFNAWTFSLAFDPHGTLFGLIDDGSGVDYLASIDTTTASGSIIAGPLSVGNLQAIALRTDSTATSVAGPHDGTIPQAYALDQNYPNPFNPSTTIRYGLPVRSHVTLNVFNSLGQQVATLVQGEQGAGYHELKFDGSNLASGVYLYRIQAGSYTETRKLLFIK
jgi:dienelactone hydrolase